MQINVQAMKRCHLITLSGDLDSASAPDLESQLLDLVGSGNGNLVLDLAGVTFISSAGLKALLHAQIRARKKIPQGKVVFAQVPPRLRETLELVGLHHLFDMYPTTMQAVGSF